MAKLEEAIIRDEIGNIPAAGSPGRIFVSTDENKVYYDTGATWEEVFVSAAASAPTDAKYITGAANGTLSAEVVKEYLSDNYDPNVYPGSPTALDDEFEGGGSIDGKWTAVNDPAGGDAFNQTDYEGFLHVGLTELGTDDFANLLQLYQTAPSGAATMTFVAKVALAMSSQGYVTEGGEFCGAGIALINSVNSQAIGIGLQFNIGALATPIFTLSFEDHFSGVAGGNQQLSTLFPGKFIYLKLEKSTANAYTSANTYNMYVSGDGVIWHQIGTGSKTFTTACDRVGLLFRRPKSQTGTPKGEALVDFFRRTA